MEVNLIRSNNLAEGTIFSVRAGNVRRQAPASSCKPFRFPEHPSESPLKIELFQPVGSAYVVLRPGETQYKVNFPTGGAVAELHVRSVEGGEKAAEPLQDDLAKDNSETAKEAKEYLESHRVMQFVQALLQTLIKEKPEDPFRYMSRHFTNGYEPNEKRAPVPANLQEEQKKEQNPSAAPSQAAGRSEVQSLRQKARDTLSQAKNDGTLSTALKDKGKKADVRPNTANTENIRQKAQAHLVNAQESGKLGQVLQNNKDGQAGKAAPAPALAKQAAAPPKASPLKKEAQQKLLTAKNDGSLNTALANKGAAKKDDGGQKGWMQQAIDTGKDIVKK